MIKFEYVGTCFTRIIFEGGRGVNMGQPLLGWLSLSMKDKQNHEHKSDKGRVL